MGLLEILQQYSDPGAPSPNDVARHFDAVAEQAAPEDLRNGIAAALRSEATPAFGETVGNLFGQSSAGQKAGLINELIRVLGPAAAATAGGGILGRILGSGTAGSAPVTPEQAEQISSTDVGTIASHVEQRDDSIVDRLSSFYAQHPTLVKTLGAVALSAVMSHMSRQRRRA